MKNLLTALVVTVSLFAFAGCASQSKATGPNGACCNMCPVSNEALPADCKVADYNGTKVGFCCEKCAAKFEKEPAKYEANLKQHAATEEPATNDRESERFRKALQEAIRNRQRAIQQSGGGEGQEEQTEEGWWQSASRMERVSWARAFYEIGRASCRERVSSPV